MWKLRRLREEEEDSEDEVDGGGRSWWGSEGAWREKRISHATHRGLPGLLDPVLFILLTQFPQALLQRLFLGRGPGLRRSRGHSSTTETNGVRSVRRGRLRLVGKERRATWRKGRSGRGCLRDVRRPKPRLPSPSFAAAAPAEPPSALSGAP